MAAPSAEKIQLETIKVNRDANIKDARNALEGEYEYILASVERSRNLYDSTLFGANQEASVLDKANEVKTEINQTISSELLDPSKASVASSQSFYSQWSASA